MTPHDRWLEPDDDDEVDLEDCMPDLDPGEPNDYPED